MRKIKKNDQIDEMMEKSHQRIGIYKKVKWTMTAIKKQQYLKLRTQQMGSIRLDTAQYRLSKLEDNSGENIQVQAHRDKMVERTKNRV